MSTWQKLVLCAVVAGLLAGCGTFKKLTGQRNDTVLPGAREDILPPDQQVNQHAASDDLAPPPPKCDPVKDPHCAPSIGDDGAGN